MTQASHEPTPTQGAIAAPHSAATEAGATALRAGGNALDAALAAAAALCVVYPNNVALGSDLVALVRTPSGEIHFINATGTAPSSVDLEALRAVHGDKLPIRGTDTITIPGAVRGWQALHALGSRLGWQAQLAAAIELAEHGVPTPRSVARAIAEYQGELASFAGWNALFCPAGTPLTEADQLVQPALAATLRTLASEGPDSFYEGALAAAWVEGVNKLGAAITLEDTAGYAVRFDQPISRAVFGHEVVTSPPNTQGFSLLRVLAELEHTFANEPDALQRSREAAGLMAELFEDANTIRETMLADPAFGGLDGEALLQVAAPQTAISSGHASGDTVGIAAVDAEGYAVSLIQSIYWGFGSAVLEPTTGILFQNRGTSFSLDAASPNAIAAGHRPRHTLMPVLVLRDGELAYVSSTMGGQGQPQIHAQILGAAFSGSTIQEAVSSPRWVVGDKRTAPAAITYEADLGAALQDELVATGRELELVEAHSEILGHANLIRVHTDGSFEAASDPRSDGSAVVVA